MTTEHDDSERAAFDRWLRGAHTPAHARRTAERNAAFFLPHLRPGMRVLDAGCGPGSITLGLAAAVAPAGWALGIDASVEAVRGAGAPESGRAGASSCFAAADAFALPFADASLDAAFSHAVLQHLRDPLAALCELHRVLRPGAVVAVADADHDGSLLWPDPDRLIARGHEILRALSQRAGGGDVYVGRRLRGLLHDAGFSRVVASVTSNCEGDAPATARTGAWWAAYYESPALAAHATAAGISDADELAAIAAAWRAWGTHPGAFWATMWCQAVGWKE